MCGPSSVAKVSEESCSILAEALTLYTKLNVGKDGKVKGNEKSVEWRETFTLTDKFLY